MSKIKLSKDLSLPLELATESTAILARKRAGKSYAARKITEQLLKAGIQVVMIDPKGDWWGIRSSADGKGSGHRVVILGGEHGDVPLEPEAGEMTAMFIIEKQVSILIDLSDFRKHQVATFMAAFMETLYRAKRKEKHRTPMTLVIDEADAIAPQNPKGARGSGHFDNTARMLGAAEDIVRRGGQRGIGIVLVTQRAAVLNKNVLTQTSILILLCTTGAQDIKAVDEWIKLHGQPEHRERVMASIASLQQGQAWVWAPGWPDDDGIFQRVGIGRIETFDSGATPKIGERKAVPSTMADVDLDAFQKEMAAAIKKADDEDPKKLQSTIRRLKKEAADQKPVVDEDAIKAAVLDATAPLIKKLDAQEFIFQEIGQIADRLSEICKAHLEVEELVKGTMSGIDVGDVPEFLKKHNAQRAAQRAAQRPDPQPPARQPAPNGNADLNGPQQRVVNSIAWWNSVGVAQPSKLQVAFVAGYKPNTGSFNNTLGSLRTAGYIVYPTAGQVQLTDAGCASASYPDSPGTLANFHDMVTDKLTNPQQKLLYPLIENYPNALSTEQLAAASGYAPNTGSFNNTRGSLRTLCLIDYPSPGMVVATDVLFPGGLS